MDNLYNKEFKIGFILTILCFTALNVISWMSAHNEYSRVAAVNKIYPAGGSYEWGFPYPSCCYEYYYIAGPGRVDNTGLVINVALMIFCAFAIGLIVSFLGRRFRARLDK